MPDLAVSLQKRNGLFVIVVIVMIVIVIIAIFVIIVTVFIAFVIVIIVINSSGKGDFLAVFNRDVSSDETLRTAFQKQYVLMCMNDANDTLLYLLIHKPTFVCTFNIPCEMTLNTM